MNNHVPESEDIKAKEAAGCAGEVNPGEAWKHLENNHSAILVDVRTPPEWTFVGVPNLASISKQPIFVQWRLFPAMEVNENFAKELEGENKLGKDSPIFFLCKTGGRSLDAAIEMTKLGYTQCYNILGGFEGDIDENGHRANKNGWKKANLPWEQR